MFSEKLRYLRRNRNLTQGVLAKRLGISTSSVGMYEQGNRFPDESMLCQIRNFFEVSYDYLLDPQIDVTTVIPCTDIQKNKDTVPGEFLVSKDQLTRLIEEAVSKSLKSYYEEPGARN